MASSYDEVLPVEDSSFWYYQITNHNKYTTLVGNVGSEGGSIYPLPSTCGSRGYMENLGASHWILCNPKTALKNKI